MITKFSNRITSLTSDSKILIIGTLNKELNTAIDKYFINKEYIEINEKSSEIINQNLYQNFDIIIFSFNQKGFDIFENNINQFPQNAIILIENDLYNQLHKYINTISVLATLPISEELFFYKIYNILSINETNKLLLSKEKISNKYKNDVANTDINEFLDKYTGSIMFLNDDLYDDFKKLKDLDISIELFKNISSNILKLTHILNRNKNLTHLSDTLMHFSTFLSSLDLESISPQKYNAFDYLTTIIEDITIYLDELFVYKLFKDAKVFEDSLENNILYFEDSLSTKENEAVDNLEYF
jgi:hypothetical protein